MSDNIVGLTLKQNAIDELTEQKIITKIEKTTFDTVLHHREVKQYGVLYNYKTKTLGEKIPIPNWLYALAEYLDLERPDNIIINKYLPGEGIYDHIDSPYFKETIASLSLNSAITMQFKLNALVEHVRLEQRSLFILRGESRYRWTHGIKHVKSDTVNGKKIPRELRYSITFRTIC